MAVVMQTPEILMTINNAIVNMVTILETFGVYIFWLSMIIFVLWVIWQIGLVARDIIQRPQ